MTDKKLKNYGEDMTEKANIAMSLLKQKGIVFPEDMEKELNCNWELYFRAGYAAAVEAMEIAKKKQQEKKSKKFDIYDFIDLRKYKDSHSHHFLESVYYDAENKKAVSTNGIYMVYCDADIPEGYENKIVDKNGVFIDARFPNWTKPIPEDSDIVETDAGKFADAIHNTDVNMNMSIAAAFKSDSHYKIGEFVFAAYYIKIIEKFINTQKDIKVYIRKEDRLGFDGKVFQPKNECAVKIIGDNATMVIMPCKADAAKDAIDIAA